ncbi:MAG: acyl carrier protein [Propionicimonas sp.]
MALPDSQVRDSIADFVVTNYLFGKADSAPAAGDSLMGKGIIDSTGILELIEFLESEFQIEVTEAETIPANLDTIDNLTAFVAAKTA